MIGSNNVCHLYSQPILPEVDEPVVLPAEPVTLPGPSEDDPWNIPGPKVNPTPKA